MKSVELIYDGTCPNVGRAREVLLRAFSEIGVAPRWTEWQRGREESPAYAESYGSPTILVDGKDVAGVEAGSGVSSCRLYSSPNGQGFSGVPAVESVVVALRSMGSGAVVPGRSWRALLSTLPGAGALLLPLGTCPACWPAYAGFLSSLGVGFLFYERYLLPIVVVMLAISLGGLAYGARSRRGYGPLLLGFGAAAIALVGKFVFGENSLLYGGFCLLLVATAWNAWPRKESPGGCPKCASIPAGMKTT